MAYVLLFVIVVALVLSGTIGVVNEYERAVVFRLGRVLGARGPGVVVIVRGLDHVRRVSVRLAVLDTPAQELITGDNVPVRVRALVYVRVVDPVSAVVNVEDYRSAVAQLAQSALRSVVGRTSLQQLLHSPEDVTAPLKEFIDQRTAEWGVEVGLVEIKDVALPDAQPVDGWPAESDESGVGSRLGVEEPT
jgi:regulator of protease activity HflC (stomatin/prohibitin superfamily)